MSDDYTPRFNVRIDETPGTKEYNALNQCADVYEKEAYDSFAEVIATDSQSGGNTVLDFGSLGTVTLTGVALSKLAADDFVFG